MYADMHCDTLTAVDDVAHGAGQISLDKLRQADCFVQCFAVFLHKEREGDALLAAFDRYADKFDAVVAAHGDLVCAVTTPREAFEARANGRVAALLTVEEGEVLQGELTNLDHLYGRGVRMLTLTWNFANHIGFPNIDAARRLARKEALFCTDARGLTPFGHEVVARMNGLGMMVDVSHLSDGGFWDVVRQSVRPVVASHSNARALCPVARNLTDEMIVALADQGGIAGLNFCYDFLTMAGGSVLDNALAHIAHLYRVGGEDVLALGGDLDGIEAHDGWDCTCMPILAARLADRLPARVVDKLLYGNFVRVWQAQQEALA